MANRNAQAARNQKAQRRRRRSSKLREILKMGSPSSEGDFHFRYKDIFEYYGFLSGSNRIFEMSAMFSA